MCEKSGLNKFQIDVVSPASDKLINKYSAQRYYQVRETAAMYNDTVKPHFITGMDM